MRSVFILSALLSVAGFRAAAQLQVTENKVSAGLKAGYNYSRLGPATTTGRNGGFAAGFMNFPSGERWRTQAEFMIALQGAEYRYETRRNNLQTTVLGLPVAVQYTPFIKRTLFLELGAQPIVNLTTRLNDSRAYKLRDFYWISDVELIGGVGGMINRTIGLNFRYNHGIKNLGRSSTVAVEPIRNRIFQVGLIVTVGEF